MYINHMSYIHIPIYIYTHCIHKNTYVYIYIYRERERESDICAMPGEDEHHSIGKWTNKCPASNCSEPTRRSAAPGKAKA